METPPQYGHVLLLFFIFYFFFGNLYFDFYIQNRFSFVTESGVLLESGILISIENSFLFYMHHNSKIKNKKY